MYINSFLPTDEPAQNISIKNLSKRLAVVGPTFGVSAAEIASVAAQSAAFDFVLNSIESVRNDLAKLVAYKNTLMFGAIGETIGAFPVPVVLPAAPAAAVAGFGETLTNLGVRIRASQGYTEATGQDLGIVPVKTNAATKSIAMVQNKPNLKVTVVGGRATLTWTKGTMSGVNIYVNKGDGRCFVLLYGSTKSKYRDMSPFPLRVGEVPKREGRFERPPRLSSFPVSASSG